MTHGVRRRSGRAVGARGARFAACSLVALAFGTAAPALAQQDASTPAPASAPTPPPAEDDERRIVVIGNRATVATLEDVPVEQTYDEDRIDSYAVSTVGELLEEIRGENGDDEPSVLVNGRPVENLGDIADFPVEAIARIEALPRGAAQRVGGSAGQRAYNVVLRSSVKSATLTGSYETASEGGWDNVKGEALLTWIAGQDRVNLTLRGAQSDVLFESEREFVPRALPIPYSPIGNIMPVSGTEIDPSLSALFGQAVTVLGLPAGVTSPTLAALVGGANRANPSELSRFRSLRGANRPLELAVSGNKTLTPQLSLSFNGRLVWTETESFSGLPAARFLIPATNPFTPFSTATYIALNDPARPLRSTSDSTNGSLSATLSGNFGDWHASVVARYDRRERTSLTDFTAPLTGGLGTVGPATNPFAGTLAAQIPVGTRRSELTNVTAQTSAEAEGPVVELWAGPLLARVGLGLAWVSLEASDTSGERSFDRHEYSAKAGITIPLTSVEPAILPILGESDLALDAAVLELGRYGTLYRYSAALNWRPIPWLLVVASEAHDDQAIAAELLAAPTVITPNVPYFDPLTGQTVDVTTIYGGAANLLPEELRTRTLSVTANPLPKYNLQLNAEYIATDLTNQIGALPPPSSAVVAAFPDRFTRDASGTLIQVDNRTVNFASQHNERLRLGVGATIPLIEAVTIPPDTAAGTPRRRIPPLRLQLNLSHNFMLESTTVIRAGLPAVDLLRGGAIGLAGGQADSTDFSAALSRGKTGLRLNMRRMGESSLVIGTLAAPDRLTFEAIATVDLRAFTDLGELFRGVRPLKDTRVTLAFDNLLNDRQRVFNTAGATPQAYQQVYRDPIGRTVMLEIRKVF